MGRTAEGSRQQRWQQIPPDYRSGAYPIVSPFFGNRVSPTRPAFAAVSEPQGTGMAEGVKDAGESERRPVIGRIRASATREYPARKGANFRRVSPIEKPSAPILLETLDGANRTDQ